MPIRLTFFDLVLFAGMVCGFVIGIHQSIYHGVAQSYWLFMISTLCFFWLNHRMKLKKERPEAPSTISKNKKASGKNSGSGSKMAKKK